MAKNIENKDLDVLSRETSSQRILLEEYRLLQSRFLHMQDEAVSRLNFFITAASVALGSVLVFGSSNSNFPALYFKITLLVILALLSVIDFNICKYLVLRGILADRYERGLARIRHYFIQIDPAIEDYFVTKITDVSTSNVMHTSGMRQTAQLIESFLLGLAAILFATFTPLAPEIDILIGLAMAVFVFVFLDLRARRQLNQVMKDVEKEAKFKSRVSAK